jgi:hypothetical protein
VEQFELRDASATSSTARPQHRRSDIMNRALRQELDDTEAELGEVLAEIETRVLAGPAFDAGRDASCQHARALLYLLERLVARLPAERERGGVMRRLSAVRRRLDALALLASRCKGAG